MKKAISFVLVFSILLLSGNLYAKKKGAELYIQKKDGHYERGELIAVRQNSILLLDKYSGADVTIDIRDIEVIRIERKSQAGIGFLLGGLIGAGIGIASYKEPQSAEGFVLHLLTFGPLGWTLGFSLLIGFFGLVIGAYTGADKTIQFEGKSDSEIQEILEKLRKKARVKNAQ